MKVWLYDHALAIQNWDRWDQRSQAHFRKNFLASIFCKKIGTIVIVTYILHVLSVTIALLKSLLLKRLRSKYSQRTTSDLYIRLER